MNRLSPAERLLIRLGIEKPNEIDLEAIAADQGVFVRYRAMDGCEARIVGDDRHAIVSINSASRPTRQRFSLAHELGHWHHHRGRCLFCSNDQIGNPAKGPLDPERQADDFASDLILPDFMIRPVLTKLKRVTVQAVSEIACEFNASLTATLLKIVKSNRFPIIAVCHGRAGRRWFDRADMVPSFWHPQDRLDPETFAHSVLTGQATDDAYPKKMPGDAWFSFRRAECYEIQEQSFRLPGDEVLTILMIPESGLG